MNAAWHLNPGVRLEILERAAAGDPVDDIAYTLGWYNTNVIAVIEWDRESSSPRRKLREAHRVGGRQTPRVAWDASILAGKAQARQMMSRWPKEARIRRQTRTPKDPPP